MHQFHLATYICGMMQVQAVLSTTTPQHSDQKVCNQPHSHSSGHHKAPPPPLLTNSSHHASCSTASASHLSRSWPAIKISNAPSRHEAIYNCPTHSDVSPSHFSSQANCDSPQFSSKLHFKPQVIVVWVLDIYEARARDGARVLDCFLPARS